MATFVHIAPERDIAAIKRNGLKPARFHPDAVPPRGVFAVPIGPDFFVSHQWLRELRRWQSGTLYGIYFRIPDDETVFAGRYNAAHQAMTAAQAGAWFRDSAELGGEVIFGRRVTPREILRAKALPQVVGWRYYPSAPGNKPYWQPPGTINAARLRRQQAAEEARYRAQIHAAFDRFASEASED